MKKIIFNVSEKKTEWEWIKSFDNFFIKIAPKWFELMAWLLILGSLYFISDNYDLILVGLIYYLSYFFLFFYLQGVFYSIEITGISQKISVIISGSLTAVSLLLVTVIVRQISDKI